MNPPLSEVLGSLSNAVDIRDNIYVAFSTVEFKEMAMSIRATVVPFIDKYTELAETILGSMTDEEVAKAVIGDAFTGACYLYYDKPEAHGRPAWGEQIQRLRRIYEELKEDKRLFS